MSNTSKVLVTGANGLLATNVIALLLDKGYSVRGLIRDPNSFKYGQHPNLELFEGDITHPQDLITATQDCTFIIHAAAITAQQLSAYASYQKVNVTATQNLLDAAITAKSKRVVYIGTANAFGYGTKEALGDESLRITSPFDKSLYAQSKLEGQTVALSFQNRISVVAVNPTFMIGPYDSKPSSGRIVLMGYRKRFIFYPPGGKNFIHVQDAAQGVVEALEKGRNGEAYLLANENLSYKEFFQKLAGRSRSRPILIKIPRPLLLIVGIVGNILIFLGIDVEVSLTNMKILCTNNYYSNEKALKEFNLSLTSIEKAIDDCIEWFATNRKK